ncbi:hypothetical protein SLA2020_243670 [Shorea laevis]
MGENCTDGTEPWSDLLERIATTFAGLIHRLHSGLLRFSFSLRLLIFPISFLLFSLDLLLELTATTNASD